MHFNCIIFLGDCALGEILLIRLFPLISWSECRSGLNFSSTVLATTYVPVREVVSSNPGRTNTKGL